MKPEFDLINEKGVIVETAVIFDTLEDAVAAYKRLHPEGLPEGWEIVDKSPQYIAEFKTRIKKLKPSLKTSQIEIDWADAQYSYKFEETVVPFKYKGKEYIYHSPLGEPWIEERTIMKESKSNEIKNITQDTIKYWSNAAGDLHHHGQYDITEDELPEELKRAYNDLYSEGYGSFCYLVETEKGYGIALVNEYDEITAENYNMTMEDLFKVVSRDANLVIETPEFSNADVYVGERTGFDECHEIIVVFPATVSKEEFSKAAESLSEILYQSFDLPCKTKSLDEKISAAEAHTLNNGYSNSYIEKKPEYEK